MYRTQLPPVLLAAVLIAVPGYSTDHELREVAPSTVTMHLPAGFGELQRPAIEFDHELHTKALEPDSCETCHRIDDQGVLVPELEAVLGAESLDDFVDAAHEACMSCHRERSAKALSSGPVTCGGCHIRRSPAVDARAAMSFDYSLHARHASAFEDKCENCHHVFDEATRKLVYEKGSEEGCSSCHGQADEERKLSLANASHRACISCHLRRARLDQSSGPSLCAGCHDLATQAELEALDEVPRLLRGQADAVWIHGEHAKSAAVGFNHLAHEKVTGACSTCHHQTLKPCDDCHSLAGSKEGGGVTVAEAYHLAMSEHSCVGCHSQAATEVGCAGCHSVSGPAPAERTCVLCHNGPAAGAEAFDSPPVFSQIQIDGPPAVSDDFPEAVSIDLLANRYEASEFPHAKIVAKLDEITRSSRLALRFHADAATLCAGCHHRTTVGERPPPCRSCHPEAVETVQSRPELKVAYHQQCVGCHIAMGLPQQGCTDCHALRTEEVKP